MRAHQDLVELRDGDLAFSADETRSLLAGFGVWLDEPELALVHQRSEGWVAGLQMAAISIQGSPDHATAAGEYEHLKQDLARQLAATTGESREAYARKKTDFIERIVAMALRDGYPREFFRA